MKNFPPNAALTVLMPALNCAQMLPAHLDAMQPWLDLATEIIVVDSASTDGTVELIRERLKHPGLRILQHPRGLYQSWNFGLQQVQTKYVYISTVGDSITRAGLEHLHRLAEKFGSDVVLSKPRSITHDDQPQDDTGYWPIMDLLATMGVTEPQRVAGIKILIFALLHIPSGILGSSASNLYRAEVLQRAPFPTSYGTTGDACWAISNAFACQFAVTPEIFSTFRHHPKAYSAKEYEVLDLSERMFQLVCETWEQNCAASAAVRADAARIGGDKFIQVVRDHAQWVRRLDAERQRSLPWFFNPAAWSARAQRNRLKKLLPEQRQLVMAQLRAR
jgi:hypothetical protein